MASREKGTAWVKNFKHKVPRRYSRADDSARSLDAPQDDDSMGVRGLPNAQKILRPRAR